jgi:hypothetical protein
VKKRKKKEAEENPPLLILRSYDDHYSVTILATKKRDIELILGKKAIENKQHTATTHSEVGFDDDQSIAFLSLRCFALMFSQSE